MTTKHNKTNNKTKVNNKPHKTKREFSSLN